ncbi:hypothetical protein [Arthrobacter sp. H5]|uniref:SRPBCC family protein n=1 Tax=Arthrobacter sp. H5 TaxID=1267973 RepID=UPI0004B92219|nr:hypothetical protein [Arthrobacter sp. H5]
MNAESNPLSAHINADARQVWTMLREPAKVKQWHGWDYDGLDAEIRLIFFSAVVEGPDHKSLTLDGGDVFRIEPAQDGTVLTMERGRPDTGSDEAGLDEDITEGWISFLQQLRFALERHPNGTRRTAFFSGESSDGTSILGKLNAEQLGQPGEKYSLTLPNGQDLSGRVWFRSDKQVGLTVEQYAEHGDGLLILADQPVIKGTRDKPGALMIATTYGLGAHSLREIWGAWDEFRARHYPSSDPLVTSKLA